MVQRIQKRKYRRPWRTAFLTVSNKTIAKVDEAMLKDRRLIVREFNKIISDVRKTTTHKILMDHLGYTKVCAK